jgi:DNA-binding transcriptional LysR family regulator
MIGGGSLLSSTPASWLPMPPTATPQYYKANRLQQLRGFCYAAQAGSVSKAAERMFLSQPSVSLQIQALERELKTSLFERRGPKISLTPDGKTLYDLAAPLVDQIDSLEDAFSARRGGIETGRLDIAAGESTTLYLLPRFVKQFSDAYPGIELKLHNVTGRDGLTRSISPSVRCSKPAMTSITNRCSLTIPC